MTVRRLIVSDLHFGSGEDLLASPAALERIEPELQWADELVVNGDLLELVFASLHEAVDAARPFLELVNRHVERVHYVVGNHDHHLVSMASDERRFADVLGTPAPRLFGVAPAARLLGALCPDVDVVTAYPVCELDGMTFTHGHHIGAHVASADWRLVDSLAWRLTGASTRPDRLSLSDYEGLIGPLYELMYEIASLPCGRHAQLRFERWLDAAAAVAHAPQRATRRLAGLAREHAQRPAAPVDPSTPQVLAAMATVCRNLEIAPGIVVFGHTHVPLEDVATPDGRHRLFNSGSWVWNRRTRSATTHGAAGAPGTVLRASGAALELRALLADCDADELAQMLGTPRGRRPSAAAA
jgi:predicted phosphodiesterase